MAWHRFPCAPGVTGVRLNSHDVSSETEIEIGLRGTEVVKIWHNGVPRVGQPLAPRDPLTSQ